MKSFLTGDYEVAKEGSQPGGEIYHVCFAWILPQHGDMSFTMWEQFLIGNGLSGYGMAMGWP